MSKRSAYLAVAVIAASLTCMGASRRNWQADASLVTDTMNTATHDAHVELLSTSEPARQALASGQIPRVTESHGGLLVLDITQWPALWRTGNVVALQRADGALVYARLLFRAQLPDGALAVGVTEASILDVVYSAGITAEGTLEELAPGASLQLVNEENVVLHEDADTGLYLTSVELNASAQVSLDLRIVRPALPARVASVLMENVTRSIERLLRRSADVVAWDADGPVVGVDRAEGQALVETLLASRSIDWKLRLITRLLGDTGRVRDVRVLMAGDLAGHMGISAKASGAGACEAVAPLGSLVLPLAGPVPISVQFDVTARAQGSFTGVTDVHGGAAITVPFQAGADVAGTDIAVLGRSDLAPGFIPVDPAFDGTRAPFQVTVDLECRTALRVDTMLTATTDPTVTLSFETDGVTSGDDTAGVCRHRMGAVRASHG